MRILRVIASMDPKSGGPCQGIRNSIPELEKLGVYNEVVCLDPGDASYLGKDEFIIHAIGPAKGPWQYAASLTPFLIEHLVGFDVVIIHGLWLYHGYSTRKALAKLQRDKSLSRLPLVFVMPHGMLDPYFQKAEDRRLKAVRNEIYWRLIESKIVNNADGVLFTCEAELLLARQSFKPYKPYKEINVGYGISQPPIFNERQKLSFEKKCLGLNGAPYLLFLSRIHEKKGVDLLIRAYIEIYRQFRHKSSKAFLFPKLVVAGPGMETDYGKSLLKIIEENPEIHDGIYFPGMLNGDAKWGAFYGCEAFILPSHQENFGIAVVEAMACGKPVLISDQVNIWREIEAANSGLVADDTFEGTQKLIHSFLDLDVSQKTVISLNALTCYENNFTNQKAAITMVESLTYELA